MSYTPPYAAPIYLNPSAIQFGAYRFPVSTMLVEIDQNTQLDEQKIPLRDGSSLPVGSRTSKTISLKGTIGGWGSVDAAGNFVLNRDQATSELQRLELALSQGKQPLIVGDSDGRFIMCQRKTFKAKPLEATRAAVVEFTIDFIADDPRWLSAAVLGSTGLAPGTQDFTSDGNAIVYPVLTIIATGAVAAFTYAIVPAGATGGITLSPTLALATGDVLKIDSNPRNRPNAILYNGVPRLDVLSTVGAIVNTIGDAEFFPYMLGGANSVTLTGSRFTWGLAWNDAFLY